MELIHIEAVKEKIYAIRGTQVMLDRDLANLYGVKAIRLREQVKRNINRFPSDFMFQLNESEINRMVSQNAIPSKMHLGGTSPYAFTEQGVAALSGVLKSQKAVETSIQIMRAFVAMRRFLVKNAEIFNRLDSIERKQIEFENVFKAMEDRSFEKKQGIFFEGQIFDAYNFVSGLVRKAKKSIILIDNYVDDSVLTLFAKNGSVDVVIYTDNISKQLKLDLKRYNSQYGPILIKEFRNSHDRFMIIDEKEVYHFGASLKDLGRKWFAFSRFDKEAIEILKKLVSLY